MTICRFVTIALFTMKVGTFVTGQRIRLSGVNLSSVRNAVVNSPIGEEEEEGVPENRELRRDRFSSFLEVVFDAVDDIDYESGDLNSIEIDGMSKDEILHTIDPVLSALITSYNSLNADSGDPFNRMLDIAEILSAEAGKDGEFLRRQLHDGRRLFSIASIIEVAGPCNGCASDANLSNQITPGRKRDLESDRKRTRTYDTGSHTRPSSDEQNGRHNRRNPDRFLPTEEEILDAWSTAVISLDNEIIMDVLFLEEIDLRSSSSSSSSSKSSKGSKSSSKGSKGSSRSKSSKSHSTGKSGKSSKSSSSSSSSSSSESSSGSYSSGKSGKSSNSSYSSGSSESSSGSHSSGKSGKSSNSSYSSGSSGKSGKSSSGSYSSGSSEKSERSSHPGRSSRRRSH